MVYKKKEGKHNKVQSMRLNWKVIRFSFIHAYARTIHNVVILFAIDILSITYYTIIYCFRPFRQENVHIVFILCPKVK